ncbi:RNA/RNP complex-1-interacting phosphatase [Dendrobates tinctorius]|uniref:RNA/RNP complex-1-interacting phosphatase n=1 Tax=Dendrobates tinctorius TaxID=92724 RepID=UPI003CC9830D
MALGSRLKFRVSFLRFPVSCHIHLPPAAMKNKNFIPERWIDYIPVGKRIPGTRFIAFKVPLKNIYDSKLAPWQRFSPSDLITEVKKQNEELGLVVDLTCTQRYYSPQELPETVMYSKIFTVGHLVPSDEVIAQFKNIVNQYLSENSGNEKLVGVHCTHGLNRTGYLVCRYLIDMLSMEPSEAVEKFNISRGHSIERSNYLEDLLHGNTRSNAVLDDHHAPNQKNLSRNNAKQPPCPEERSRSHGHTHDAPRWGPRVPGPRYAPPSLHHAPLQMMGPRRGFPHYGVRDPSHGPMVPPPGFPHMPGPRHSLQMEDGPPRHFRGPMRHRHYRQRPFPQHGAFETVNGAPPQDRRPDPVPQSDHNSGHSFPEHSPHSQQKQRNPRPAQKRHLNKRWQ